MDSEGLALEWTASDWERGTPTGEKVVRGSRSEKVSWLSTRCAHSRKRDPNKSYDDVGFRCCSGTPNGARVVMSQRKLDTLVEEPGVTTAFEMELMGAMPRDHRGTPTVRLSFDQVYRWHPVPNEELVVGRWAAEPRDGGPYFEVAVFKLCAGRASRVAGMRGPVAKLGKPRVDAAPSKLAFDVQTDDRRGAVGLGYWYGTVKLTQPDWVQAGSELTVGKPGRIELDKVPITGKFKLPRPRPKR
jgi:hypothetical protein